VPNVPLVQTLPVVVQFRGFADRSSYTPGLGTKHSAEVFAQNGFVSLAPDFLGYGGSDMGSTQVFEDRFETYTTALNLLASIPTISFVDPTRVFLWGHSNGGQIALSVQAILGEKGKKYPTTLWAPVTKIFPYSILYYTDEFDDYGKALRHELAVFESEYDTDQFAFFNYLDRIQAPLQLHQGTKDELVPQKWNDDFVKLMKEKGKSIRYYTYPEADHNLNTGWSTVVKRDIDFFRSFSLLET
jgi:dipeptidyl aminopeptidase/acylaminoacyl peptidase